VLEWEVNIIQRLKKLGEDESSGSVYIAILKLGSATKYEIATITNLDPDEVSGAIERLTLLPLIVADLDRKHQIVYHVLPPLQAFQGIAASIRWQTRETLHDVSDLHKLSENEQAYLSDIHTICHELSSLVQSHYQFRSSVSVEMVTAAHTKEQMTAYVSESISTATSEIVAIVSPPHLLGPIVWESLLHRMREGIPYRRVTVPSEILRHGFKIALREVTEIGEDLYFIEPEKINQKFYVIDKQVVVFFNPAVTSGEFRFTGQVIRNQGLALRYYDHFNRLREEAIPAHFVLDQVRDIREEMIRASVSLLDPMGAKWVQHVIDYGVFMRLPDMTHEQKENAFRQALDAGLVKIQSGDIVANLNIDMHQIRSAWHSHKHISDTTHNNSQLNSH